MILTFDQLAALRGSVSMVDGAFDPLHAGHIEYFRGIANPIAAMVQMSHWTEVSPGFRNSFMRMAF